MLRKSIIVCLVFLMTAMTGTTVCAASSTESHIDDYNSYYAEYLQHDKVIADTFLAGYNNSEAQALVARAIWYMENGYMVYGHSKYRDTGYIDCSNFVSLLYKDFGYSITSASKNYTQVGEKISGVYSRKIPGKSQYELVGTEKLRPGDIFTFWKQDSDGSGTHIGHVALYMGIINGEPAIIHTYADRPTAIGITTSFKYWYGEHFSSARRVLDGASQSPQKPWQAAKPTIPAVYQLPPQKPIVAPAAKYMSNQNTARFSDISGHWAEDDILSLVKKGVVDGYPDGTFRASRGVTRAEFATALVKAFDISLKSGKVFRDTSSHWARNYISAAANRGIVSGYSSYYFGPDDPITREQMAVMIVAAAEIDTGVKGSLKEFYGDSTSISSWARQAVLAAHRKKLIEGYSDDTYRPQRGANRAEAVTVICRALEL